MLMSSQAARQIQQHMMGGGGGGGGGGQFNDTTFTKIFVGGLAWETQRDTMRKYFEEFGEILEAVVITDKATGRSKGYGFVTFKDAEAAVRACQNPAPVIDGRKANCNLASLGAHKNRPPPPPSYPQVGGPGGGWMRSAAGLVAPPTFPAAAAAAASTYFQLQQSAHLTFPNYSAYGYYCAQLNFPHASIQHTLHLYTGFSHDAMYPVSYYGVYGSQQYSPYYTGGGGGGGGGGGTGGGAAGYMYPYYGGSYAAGQGSQTQQHHGGYGVHYNHPAAAHMLQYSYFTQQQQQQQHYFPSGSTSGILSLPATSLAFPAAAAISLGLTPTAGSTQSGAGLGQVHPPHQAAGASGSIPENNSSST